MTPSTYPKYPDQQTSVSIMGQSGMPASEVGTEHPWDRTFSDLSELERVRVVQGEFFGHQLHWIPGVVLATVDPGEDYQEALAELKAALGSTGLSTGILLFLDHRRRPPGIPAEQRADGRIRIEVANPQDVNLHSGRPDTFARQVAQTHLQELGRRSSAWLAERTLHAKARMR